MKIIPVLDILDGTAVHAVRGQRKQYKPLDSRLCVSTHPLDVAIALKKLGFAELYVADIDAILGRDQRLLAVKQIAEESKIRLMVDAGVSDLGRGRDVLESGASKLVIGTETLSSADFVRNALRSFGEDRVLVSIDLMNGDVIGNLNERSSGAVELLQCFCDMGLHQVIILDLARVGTSQGVNLAFLRRLHKKLDLELFVGGGVRDIADLMELREFGLHGVLLSTALHSGAVTVEELNNANMEI